MTDRHWAMLIEKDNIKNTRIESLSSDETELNPGEVEVAVRRFALTANNITYATLGKSFGKWTDMPGYWAFFPAASDTDGQLPVWGFAEIVRSANSDVPVGDELYGYFPLASHLVMRPGRITDASLIDTTPHREKLAPVYNQYNRVSGMTDLLVEEKDLWPVFRPLLVTGYMICDQFEENKFYGADQILITSASSKTSMMTANCFRGFKGAPKLIGLTSARNKEFVERSGLYDSVQTYDEITSMPTDTPIAMIDMAGNGDVINEVHKHFKDQLTFSLLVGLSHWDSARPAKNLPGPPVTPFFAPGRIKQRSGEWGSDGLRDRLAAAWDSFADKAPSLTKLNITSGPDAAKQAYDQLVAGNINPEVSTLITL